MLGWKLAALAAACGAVGWAGDKSPLPEGRGKKILEMACVSCHALDVVTAQKLSKQRWQVLVLGMTDDRTVSKGEQAVLVDYLTANFGQKDRGQELVEEICSLCHEWQRIQEQHLSKEQWAGVIKGMIFEGAPVTDAEFDQIVAYLARTYGKTKE